MSKKKFQEIVTFRLITTLIALAFFYTIAVPNVDNSQLWAIAGLEIVTVCLDISWFFQGMEQFGVIALTNISARLLSIIFIVLFVRERSQLTLYVFLYCLFLILGFIAQWFFVYRYISHSRWDIDKTELKKHLKIAAGLFIAQAAIQIYTVLDKTMIGLITHSNLQNGYYEEAQKLIRVLVAVSTSIGTVMASRVAFLWADKKIQEITKLLMVSFRIVSCIGLFIFMVLQLCADLFVPVYYGEEYLGVIILLQILSLQPIIIGFSSVVGMQFFVPTGKEKYLTLSVGIGSTMNVVMNLILIPHMQAAGAALASVFAELSVTGIQIYIGRKYLDMKPIPSIFLRYLLLTIPSMAAGYGVKLLSGNSGTGSLFLTAFSCGTVYLLGMLITKDPLVNILLKKDLKNINE